MKKIASPQDLQAELRRLLAYSQEARPSREVLASELRDLAIRVVIGLSKGDHRQIEKALTDLKVDWKKLPDGSYDAGGLKIYWDTQDPHNKGWAWQTRRDSGPLDSVKEIKSLV